MEITLPNSQGNQSFRSVAGKRSNGRAVYLGDPRLVLLGRSPIGVEKSALTTPCPVAAGSVFSGKVQLSGSCREYQPVTSSSLPVTLWTLPFPSSGLMDTTLIVLGGRECSVVMRDEPDEQKPLTIVFSGVLSVLFTYIESMNYMAVRVAYDKLVDLGSTSWLHDAKEALNRHGESSANVRHLGILFDDGPFYEFLCEGYRIEGEA